jgi:hypothetical protein
MYALKKIFVLQEVQTNSILSPCSNDRRMNLSQHIIKIKLRIINIAIFACRVDLWRRRDVCYTTLTQIQRSSEVCDLSKQRCAPTQGFTIHVRRKEISNVITCFIASSHIYRVISKILTVQLGYDVMKGTEYFCITINECCFNRCV